MDFLHADFTGGSEYVVIVTMDRQANVMLLDDASFAAYRYGNSFQYYGGWASCSPARVSPPCYGHWHLVVDLGGGTGTVRVGVRIIRGRPQETLF